MMGRFNLVLALSLLAGIGSAAIAAPSSQDESWYPNSPNGGAAGKQRTAVLLNLGELVSADDYPPQAQMGDEQGTVDVLVKVDEAGHVADCQIEQSSGSAALDTQTCRLFWLRAKFTPAQDKAGKPTVSVYSRKITWRLEGDAVPVTPWASKLFVTLKTDGAVDCKFTVEGSLLNRERREEKMTCEDMFGELAVLKASQESRGTGTMLVEQRFAPGNQAVSAVRPKVNGQLLFWSVLHLQIDRDGKLTGCSEAKTAGEYPIPKPCETVPKLFMKPMNKAGIPIAMDATVTITASGLADSPNN